MKIYTLILLSVLTILIKQSTAQNSNIDSLKIISNSNIDSNSIKIACRIALILSENEPQECLPLLNRLIPISKSIRFSSGEAKLYNIKGICFDVLSQYDSAITSYQSAYTISNKHHLTKTKGSALNNLGMIYWNIGNYDLAIKNYLLALKQFEELKSENNIANTTNNIGLVYADMKNYPEALKFYLKSLALHRKNNNQYGIASVQTNIGIVYYYFNRFDKSASYLDSSITIKRLINDDYGLAISLNHRADVFIKLKKNEPAKKILLEASHILEHIGNKNMLFGTYMSLSNILKRESDFKGAMDYNLKILAISKEIGSLRKQEIALGDLSFIYENLGNFEMAYYYLNESKTISDSILNIENFESINDMKEKYETEKKEKENLSLLFENNKQKNKMIWIAFLGSLLIVFSGITVWIYMYKRKQQLIQEQNLKLNETIFETELQERERIARDLHDSVGQKLSVVKMQLSLKNTDTHSAIKLLDETIQEVREVSHNLIPADLNKGLMQALENMCEQINYHSQTLKIHLNYNTNSIDLKKQEESFIYRIIQELTNNALKYSHAKNIYINFTHSKNTLHIELKDDGIGFDISKLKNKNGIGIKNIQDRVEKMNGSWQLESKKNSGTSYNIKLILN